MPKTPKSGKKEPEETAPVKPAESDWQAVHDEASRTIRRTMLAVLGYCFFCILVLIAPDLDRLSKVTIPFAQVKVSFELFLIFGPTVLLVLMAYLHVFIGELHRCPASDVTPLPFIFNMDSPLPKVMAVFIFYGLTPAVLLIFAGQATKDILKVSLGWGAFFSLVFFGWLWVKRNFHVPKRYLSVLVAPFFVVVGLGNLSIGPQPSAFSSGVAPQGKSASATDKKPSPDQPEKDLAADTPQPTATTTRPVDHGDSTEGDKAIDAPSPGRVAKKGEDHSGGAEAPVSVVQTVQKAIRSVVKTGLGLNRRLNLSRQKLSGRDFEGVDLRGAILVNTILAGVNFRDKDLSGANLSRANLSDANLEKAILNGANLTGANLRGANLGFAEFIRADLSGSDLSGANLTDTNFGEAILTNTNLSKADLKFLKYHPKFLTQAQLDQACIDKGVPPANLPDNLAAPTKICSPK